MVMRSGRAGQTGRNRVVFPVLLLFVSSGLSLVLLEGITGYLYERLPFANGKRTIDLYLERPAAAGSTAVGNEAASLLPHPYLLYTHTPNLAADGYVQTNSLGYRNEEFTVDKPPNTVRILVLGGSTTFMWPFIKNPADTWVARLEAKLQAMTSRKVQVVNAGLNYGTSAEALAGYMFRHRFLQPDIVLYHGGGNDVMPLFFSDYTPEYSHFRQHGAGTVPRPGERTLLAWSNTAKYLYARWLEPVGSVVVTEPFWDVDPQTALRRVRTQAPEGFQRNLDMLVAASKAAGSDVVLFGFLQARKQYLSTRAAAFRGYEDALVEGLAKNYRVMQDIAERHAVPFIIPPQERFRDEWFQDNCHLFPEGEEVKAQILFEHLRSHARFRSGS
ncbi:hypothetical protein FBQ96_14240 [Nitrospirales bacterium NOB]|nr:hypothetical protein [Nitrospira sp. NTP2]MDL1890708.1 hypothetical protein [Nitrospirales bacterium NOB]RIK57161.1 MAG: hypothetical protein DCC63_14890 [Nitrospira sp.]